MASKVTFSAMVLALAASAAVADQNAESAIFAGHYVYGADGSVISSPVATRGLTAIYDNTDTANATAIRGFSSGDPDAIFGDDIDTVGTGRISAFTLSLFNSSGGGNTMPVTGGTVNVDFFRASDASHVAGFSRTFALAGLNPGFFTLLTFTGLQGLAMDTSDLIVLQQFSGLTGGSIRTGIVSIEPIALGMAIPQLYIDAADVGGGAAGFYNLTSGGQPVNFFMAYGASIPAPGSLALLALGGLAAARRRR